MIPAGQYERLSAKAPCDPQRAELFRSEGTWWLRCDDGHETNTFHSCALRGGFRKAEMLVVVTASNS
jgi:hypothetical protein